MANASLWWLFLIPLVFSGISIILLPKLNSEIDYKSASIFAGVGLVISMLIITVCFFVGKGSKTHDVQVLNGQITAKDRDHGHYIESYSCRCRTVYSGTGQNRTSRRKCDTCYRDHYTVKWTASSNVGNFTIESLDRTSRSVYNTPDPERYTRIKIGEACAVESSYTNYIKAVPETLFRPAGESLKKQFAGMIPAYPINIHDMWKLNRVIPVRINVPDLAKWNEHLSNDLRVLGPQKQANVVVILANTPDETYSYAVRDAWLNGKKNDIVVIIGATNFPQKANWVNVLALTDNEIFKIKLRDDIKDLPELTREAVLGAIYKNTMKYYKRKSMKDFAYLDAEIDPPKWVNITTVLLNIFAYVGFWIFVKRSGDRVSARESRYNNFARNRGYI